MCDQAEKQRLYKEIWQQVECEYRKGFCVSERGLQAVLYAELRKKLSSDTHVVVEPTWNTADGKVRPDLVIVKGEKITDIFELKFGRDECPEFEGDIDKLFRYIKKLDERYLVRLDPKTGQWKDSLPVQDGCLLHFVAVTPLDADAVWTPSLKKEVRKRSTDNEKLNHWFGRISNGGAAWDIEFDVTSVPT